MADQVNIYCDSLCAQVLIAELRLLDSIKNRNCSVLEMRSLAASGGMYRWSMQAALFVLLIYRQRLKIAVPVLKLRAFYMPS